MAYHKRTVLILVVAVTLIGCNSSSSSQHQNQPDIPVAPVSLPKSESEHLWSLEHHSNILVQYGLKQLGHALKNGDRKGVAALLSGDFDGSLPDASKMTKLHSKDWAAERTGLTSNTVPIDREGFINFLFDVRKKFGSEVNVNFGIKLLSPANRHQLTGTWHATCQMRLLGEGVTGQPRESTLILQMITKTPSKEKIEDGAWLVHCKVEQLSEAHSIRHLFENVTERYGALLPNLHDNWTSLETQQSTGGLYASDFNRDGVTDLLVTDVNPAGYALLRGKVGGGFENVTTTVRLNEAAVDGNINAAWVDFNDDGWPDILHANGRVFINDKGQTFSDATGQSTFGEAAYLETPELRHSINGFAISDYDRDGLVDVYITRTGFQPDTWLQETSEFQYDSQLLRNLGGGNFEDVTPTSKTNGGGRSVFTAVWYDADQDYWPDLYVINEFGDGVLYINEQDGTFDARDIDSTTSDFGVMGITHGDVNNDGLSDLYLGSMYSKAGSRIIGNMASNSYDNKVMDRLRTLISGSQLYLGEGDLKYKPVGNEFQVHDIGWAWGPAMADWNNDGWLDIYATAGYMSRERGKPDG